MLMTYTYFSHHILYNYHWTT